MKIALSQQNYHIGNFEENTRRIIEGIEHAKKQGADLVVFSELCICGYPPRDFLEFTDFIDQCLTSVNRVAQHARGIGVLVGAPSRNPLPEGKDLFNSVYFLEDGKQQQVFHKTLLPNYDVFDEYRYFEPSAECSLLQFKGVKIAITICEDIWNMEDNPMYRVTPMEQLIKGGPELIINLSASPYNYEQDTVRKSLVRAHTLRYGIPMIYVNTVGSQTEIVFDGGSLVYASDGSLVKELKYFEEDFDVVELDTLKRKASDKSFNEEEHYYQSTVVSGEQHRVEFLTGIRHISEIRQALVLGIRDYFRKMGFTHAILGASGGIDSAVTQALAVEALGKNNVTAVLMPSPFSSSHSVIDAKELSGNLGNPFHTISIDEIYETFLSALKPVFEDRPFSVAEENIQSRTRGNLLMAIANKFGYILLNTSNKSELATGYGTLYGDMAGGISVLGDVYKVQVYALAHHLNEKQIVIPPNIIHKAPSAELRPGQKDIDSLPEYNILDEILYQYIELRRGPREILEQGYEKALVDRILKMVNTSEYKRNQFCPIIRVSNKAFGIGRRIPIVGKYLS